MSAGKKRLVLTSCGILIVVTGLAGGGVLAARNGWQPPAWLRFWNRDGQTAQPVDVGLFCNAHGVPEKFCTLCHAELKEKLLMCTEHGLPEAVCTLCHPENEQKYGLKGICRDHGLPEALCPQCNPGLAAGEVESDWCAGHGIPESLCILCDPQRAERVAMCTEHGVPEAVCTICRPELSANFTVCEQHKLPTAFCPEGAACRTSGGKQADCPDCRTGEPCPDGTCPVPQTPSADKPTVAKATMPRVRLAKADIAEKAGIEVAPVQKASSAPALTVNCEVGYDENRLAHVRPRVNGIVHEVRVDVGDSVRKGDALAVVDSAELGEAKANYLAALPLVDLWTENVERLKKLSDKEIVAGKDLLEARTELQQAKAQLIKSRQKLHNFGLPTHEIAGLSEEDERDRNLLTIVAPQDGTVVRRHAVEGEAVQATTELFAVADLSRMWVHLDVYEDNLSRIKRGQPVSVRIPGLAPRKFSGKVSWIDSEIDQKTRTVHVRAEVKNPEGLLRANMFGEAEIRLGATQTSLRVPKEAVQRDGSSFVVFVRKESGLYEPRRVLVGRRDGARMQLAWSDLQPGDSVVTTGSFLLKTELQKGSIGAGCCGE